jgi:hypothetical protein
MGLIEPVRSISPCAARPQTWSDGCRDVPTPLLKKAQHPSVVCHDMRVECWRPCGELLFISLDTEKVRKFELVAQPKTASARGMTTLLLRADEVD